MPTTRRRHARVCVMCTVWLTRHPSRICRDCRPHAGDAVIHFSSTIERNTA